MKHYFLILLLLLVGCSNEIDNNEDSDNYERLYQETIWLNNYPGWVEIIQDYKKYNNIIDSNIIFKYINSSNYYINATFCVSGYIGEVKVFYFEVDVSVPPKDKFDNYSVFVQDRCHYTTIELSHIDRIVVQIPESYYNKIINN
jgi:hypothetical protein